RVPDREGATRARTRAGSAERGHLAHAPRPAAARAHGERAAQLGGCAALLARSLALDVSPFTVAEEHDGRVRRGARVEESGGAEPFSGARLAPAANERLGAGGADGAEPGRLPALPLCVCRRWTAGKVRRGGGPAADDETRRARATPRRPQGGTCA